MDTRTKQERMQALGDLMATMMDADTDTDVCVECHGHPATGAIRFPELCEFCGYVAGCEQ